MNAEFVFPTVAKPCLFKRLGAEGQLILVSVLFAILNLVSAVHSSASLYRLLCYAKIVHFNPIIFFQLFGVSFGRSPCRETSPVFQLELRRSLLEGFGRREEVATPPTLSNTYDVESVCLCI